MALMFVLAVMCVMVYRTTSLCVNDTDVEIMKISNRDRAALLHSQLQFSADMLQTVGSAQASENVFFSPSSVYNALLLAYFASANQTEDSLKELLQLPEEQDKLGTLGAYSLEKYYQKMRIYKNSLDYKLRNANRIYVSKEYKVKPCIKKHFDAEIELADFGSNVSATIAGINKWVSTETENNINDLLSTDSLNSNTNLVLVNAAYFRGLWKNQFLPSETREIDFILANGTRVPTMMMSLESKFSHGVEEDLGVEVLELPYEGDDISMFILLPLTPSETAIADLLNKTNAKIFEDIVEKSSTGLGDVAILIPKFSADQTIDLTPVLESMGVGDLFQDSADLSSLTGSPGLHLDSAIHKAKISVDETGTVAAAATAIFANRFAANSFVANHPFVYFIFDKKSKILLFVGIFNSPET